MAAVSGERILVGGGGDADASLVEGGVFSIAGVAVSALLPSVVAVFISSCARGGSDEGAFVSFAVANFDGVFRIELTEFTAVIKIAAEFSAGHHGVGEVALAVELFVTERPAGDTAFGRSGKFAETGVDGAEDGARHFHE